MLGIAAATAGCLHPCCHFHYIFAAEEKTSTVSSTNRSYSHAVLEPWESLNCLSLVPLLALNHLCKYIQSRREKDEAGYGLLETPRKKAQGVIPSVLWN